MFTILSSRTIDSLDREISRYSIASQNQGFVSRLFVHVLGVVIGSNHDKDGGLNTQAPPKAARWLRSRKIPHRMSYGGGMKNLFEHETFRSPSPGFRSFLHFFGFVHDHDLRPGFAMRI